MVSKVKGYTDLTEEKVSIVNQNKIVEEEILRAIDEALELQPTQPDRFDYRSASIARTKFQEAFMWLNRSIFKPERVKLPGDPE